MKLRLQILPTFLISAVALLSFTFYFLKNFNSFNSERFKAYAASDFTIYTDQLNSSFSDWSWSSQRNFQATDQVKTGTSSISFTPNAWGGLYLHTDNQIDTTIYDALMLSVRGSSNGQKFSIVLNDSNNQPIGSAQSLTNFGGDVITNQWKTYIIPLKTLNPSSLPIKGIVLQEITGQNQPTVYLDDIILTGKAIPTPTPTMTATPTPSPAIQQNSNSTQSPTSLSLYYDNLSTNWENWSWNSTIDLANSTPVFSGTKSLVFQVYNAWGALYLHAKTLVDTTPYSNISFAVYAVQSGQKYSVILTDSSNNPLTNPIPLKAVGGDPVANSWKTYSIPLSTLNAVNKQISGFIIQDQAGHWQPTLFVDDIKLNSVQSSPQAQSPALLTNPLSSSALFVQPDTNAKKTADAWRQSGRYADADQISKIANNATAVWITEGDPYTKVNNYVSAAQAANALPVMVTYNIPGRDCGQYSSGGTTYEAYKSWITTLGNAIGSRKAVVVLEPDALGLPCLQNDNTYSLLRYAVDSLLAHPGVTVYITASPWVDPTTMANRLNASGINHTQGFAINVSGFDTTSSMAQYGNTLSGKLGGKHFVVDTSRNGNGPFDQSQPEPWCNPPDRALGIRPTTNTGNPLIDAYLWIKIPGESDGTCRGGPPAGQWWSDYALGLAQRAGY